MFITLRNGIQISVRVKRLHIQREAATGNMVMFDWENVLDSPNNQIGWIRREEIVAVHTEPEEGDNPPDDPGDSLTEIGMYL